MNRKGEIVWSSDFRKELSDFLWSSQYWWNVNFVAKRVSAPEKWWILIMPLEAWQILMKILDDPSTEKIESMLRDLGFEEDVIRDMTNKLWKTIRDLWHIFSNLEQK